MLAEMVLVANRSMASILRIPNFMQDRREPLRAYNATTGFEVQQEMRARRSRSPASSGAQRLYRSYGAREDLRSTSRAQSVILAALYLRRIPNLGSRAR